MHLLTGTDVKDSVSVTYIDVTWHTTAISIQPPSCRIKWDAQYLIPKDGAVANSLLPGCFINDSQEGYHVTYYWIHILEWEMD